MKKSIVLTGLISICLLVGVIFQVQGWTAPPPSASVRITGVVKQPLNIQIEDLSKYESVNIRATEVTGDKKYRGAFNFRGVPLKTLLDLARIEKEKKDFGKAVDLAIVVRNKAGKQVVLSWGEIMFRNPGDAVLAYSSSPVMPYRSCNMCHTTDIYKEWQGQLTRAIGYPKLVLPNDFYTDRSLEDVVHIEVVDLDPKLTTQKMKKIFAPALSIVGDGKTLATLNDLSAYPRAEIMTKPVGDGMGFHGLRLYAGTPLIRILEKTGVKMDTETALIVSSIDGYRSLLSYGELYLATGGDRILIADRLNGKPLDNHGKFLLMPTDDLGADRDVKAVNKIEIVSLKRDPKVLIISTGCADTSLLTLEALNYFAKADVFVCTEDQKVRFANYIGNRPVLFDYFKYEMPNPVYKKELEKMSHEQRDKLRKQRAAEAVQIIKGALNQGKTIAILEYGDPSIYGSMRHMAEIFRQEKIEHKFIPGVSAFNAANAAIGKEMACKGGIVLTSYWGLKEDEATLKAIAKNGDTLVIFMGLKETQNLIALLKKYYPDSVPVNLAFNVGAAANSRVYKTTLGETAATAAKVDEKWLAMIYIGPCVK